MALDGAYLYTVKQELKDLIRGRIDKIYQPSKDEIIISIRTVKGTFKLLISASASSARVHITTEQVENAFEKTAWGRKAYRRTSGWT